jgi:hypothetical protein
MYLLFNDLGRLFAEAALIGGLPPDERDALAETIEDWHEQLSDYGVDDAFPVAIRALQDGWDDPQLQNVLEGKSRDWPPASRGDETEQALTLVRLEVLEACDRGQEYLNLSKACGAKAKHAAMLAKLDRDDEAVAFATKSFKTPGEAYDLAKDLRALGKDDRAMAMGEFGLGAADHHPHASDRQSALHPEERAFNVDKAHLAQWLRDYAGAMGDLKLALKAARVAFSRTHSSEDFHAAERWAKTDRAGRAWQITRKAMLAELAAADHAWDRVSIFLDEGMIAEAINAAGAKGERADGTETLLRLAVAAVQSHPEWVVDVAVGRANAIMDDGRSGHYHEAAQWLETASHAFIGASRDEEWLSLIDSLIETHRRKHKLRALLQKLR